MSPLWVKMVPASIFYPFLNITHVNSTDNSENLYNYPFMLYRQQKLSCDHLFIFRSLRVSPNQVIYAFSYQTWESFLIRSGLYQNILAQDIGVHTGVARNNFPLPISPINVSPGVNGPNFNYRM